jgi:hypothetical protein
MRSESFLELIQRKSGELVYLVRGFDQDKPAWYYIKLYKTQLPIFLKIAKLERGKIPLTKYGEVIEYGWGVDPPIHIQQKIKEAFV